MAKKTSKGGQMEAVQEKKAVKGVRLDLSPADHRRLNKLAKERGLTMSSYARMAVFERMKDDERRKEVTMATRQQVRDAMHRQPFLGFTIRLTDGRSFFVKHPDFISVPETDRGRDLIVHDKGTHRIDLLHVVEVDEPEAGGALSPAESAAEGNGA